LADVDATVVDVEATIWAGALGGGALTVEVVLLRRARSAASRVGDPSGAANGFALVGVVDSEVVATLRVLVVVGPPRSAASLEGEPSGAFKPDTAALCSWVRSAFVASAKPTADNTRTTASTGRRKRAGCGIKAPVTGACRRLL
jgi:hypothetical protein